MGFRFRRSIRLLPGVRLNLSKGTPSLSVGPRGLTANIGRRGVRTTVGLPGSGLSYTSRTTPWGGGDEAGQAPRQLPGQQLPGHQLPGEAAPPRRGLNPLWVVLAIAALAALVLLGNTPG